MQKGKALAYVTNTYLIFALNDLKTVDIKKNAFTHQS